MALQWASKYEFFFRLHNSKFSFQSSENLLFNIRVILVLFYVYVVD